MKKGILIAAFGSSNPRAHQVLEGFLDKVRLAFPGVGVRVAFTSGIIRRRLAHDGKKTDSVEKALQKMWFEKYDRVAVQSLHVIPGAEFNQLLEAADRMRRSGRGDQGFERILVGAPLLSDLEDAARTARAIVRHLPRARRPGEPVILMGHGTWHKGDSMYEVLSRETVRLDKDIHIATMDGVTTIDQVLARLDPAGVKKVWLIPLLAVAGAHVVRDMAGDEPESWKSKVVRAGMECVAVLRGAAEYDGFEEIWLEHLARVMGELDRPGPA